MDLAGYVVPGRGRRGAQRRRGGGRAGCRRPHTSPTAVPARLEEKIIALRKALSDEGLDAGAATIQWHLSRRRRRQVPSVSTIWRILAGGAS